MKEESPLQNVAELKLHCVRAQVAGFTVVTSEMNDAMRELLLRSETPEPPKPA